MIREHTITINNKKYPHDKPVIELMGEPVSIFELRDKVSNLNHQIAEKNKELIHCYNVEAKLTRQILNLRMKLKETIK